MNKSILSVAFVAAILSVGAYNYTQNQKRASMDNLTLANIDALASGESGGSVTCNCGALWGTGCKADNYGATCAPGGTALCSLYATNCS